MKATYTLLCPSIAESQCGMLIGAEKTLRNHLYRFEMYAGSIPKCFRDGVESTWEKMPLAFCKMSHDAADSMPLVDWRDFLNGVEA